MEINSDFFIQIALCTLLFIAVFFLMRSTSRTEKKLDEVRKED